MLLDNLTGGPFLMIKVGIRIDENRRLRPLLGKVHL